MSKINTGSKSSVRNIRRRQRKTDRGAGDNLTHHHTSFQSIPEIKDAISFAGRICEIGVQTKARPLTLL